LGIRGDRERGATLVEAAFVLPFLLLLTFGIFTVARAWQVNNAIDHAVREAARYGATSDPFDSAAVSAVVANELAASAVSIPGGGIVCAEPTQFGVVPSVCGSPLISNAPPGTENVVVRVRWSDYELNFLFFTIDIDLTGTAVSRWEK
jgi:Flp pilus assembly protein TadG